MTSFNNSWTSILDCLKLRISYFVNVDHVRSRHPKPTYSPYIELEVAPHIRYS